MPSKVYEDKRGEAPTGPRSVVRSFGLVFGDIGTSPIYTLTVIFLTLPVTEINVMGVLSLVIWTLTILVSVEYAWLAMGLGRHGEGGTIILRSVLLPLLRKGRAVAVVTMLTYIGVSLLVGDGVITPAISILSAVEGVVLIPGLEHTGREALIGLAAGIAFLLFVFQRKGTERVSNFFGPLMLVWFLSLSVSGLVAISTVPSIWKVVNPSYALQFLAHHGVAGFFVLSEVILCATGGEALYADMGQLGRAPIVRAWYFVFAALTLNYLGQGAFLLQTGGASQHVLFRMVLAQSHLLYAPFLLLGICATVIASQAMIAGMFSIVYQGINTGMMPRVKVNYTSRQIHSQVYIGSVNWLLLVAVLFIIFLFRSSDSLASAYGLAVTGTMTLTGIMMTWIFSRRRDYLRMGVAFLVTLVDLLFLVANVDKIPHGAYWSLVIALLPFCIILIYTKGQTRLHRAARPLALSAFLPDFTNAYDARRILQGSAIFFVGREGEVPLYVARTMLHDGIIYDTNVLLHMSTIDRPFGVLLTTDQPAEGLTICTIETGYMEVICLEDMLKTKGIAEKVVFYGQVEITSRHVIWKIYSALKRLSPPVARFYGLPADKLRGVTYSVEI